jgi:hypothetical protein
MQRATTALLAASGSGQPAGNMAIDWNKKEDS